MASSKRTESDLTSVSSGLSTAPDEPTANGKPSKATKAKPTKPAAAKKTKAQTASTAPAKKGSTSKNGTAKDSGRPAKDMNKAKPNGKGKGKAVVQEVEKVEKRQRTYGLLPQDLIEYQEDEDIKSDWQVPYVWAFLVKFCKDSIKGLCVVDDLEQGLKSMGPHDGVAEALAALLKGVQGHNPAGKPKNDPNPDDLAISVKKLLDKRLVAGSPLTVFDSYVYEVKSYVTKEQGDASASARKEQDLYHDLETTDVQDDRRRRNPLAVNGFWAVAWQVRLKILRQLVDWTLTTKGPVREALDSLYAAKKNRPVTTEYSCDIEGLKDGNKRYIYRVDPSYRVYAANKMYHMGTPLYTLTSTRDEYESLIAEYKASQDVLDQMQKGGKKNSVGKRNAENNVKAAERLQEDLPKIEEAEAEIIRAKERYEKAQLRKLRALAQLEASSFALTTRSRTRKVVNYNETHAEDDFEEEESPREYQPKRQGRSSTNSSFQADSMRGAKRDYDEVDSAETSEAAFDESRNSRASKRTRRVDSAESETSPVETSPVEDVVDGHPSADLQQAPAETQELENGVFGQAMSE